MEEEEKEVAAIMTDDRGGGAGSSLGAFYACYLVGSLNPAMKGRSYVGFTVNPERRIRQHNGVLAAGARYTRRLRPCEMVLLVGFMRIVSPAFCNRWRRRALNVHPSLLPAFAGGMDLEVRERAALSLPREPHTLPAYS